MMSAQHTPEYIWRMETSGRFKGAVAGNDGEMVCDPTGNGRLDEEAEANDRLKAAAPKMLDALREVLRWKKNLPPEVAKLVVEAAGEATVGKKKPVLDDLCPREGERVLLDISGYGNFVYYTLLEYSEDWDLMKLRREGEDGVAVTVSLSGLEKNWRFWRSTSSARGDKPGTLWCEMCKSEEVGKGV